MSFKTDPRSPAEILDTFMQALVSRNLEALAVLGKGETPASLAFVGELQVSDYRYQQIAGGDGNEALFELVLKVRDGGETVLQQGAQRCIAVVSRRGNDPYFYVTAIAPQESWLSPEALEGLLSVWPASFLSSPGRIGAFEAPGDIEPEALAQAVIALGRAHRAALGQPVEKTLSQEEFDEAAMRYFGIEDFDATELYCENRVDDPAMRYFDPETKTYAAKGEWTLDTRQRVVAVEADPDGGAWVTVERYADAFGLASAGRLHYRMEPNADGSYRVAAALPTRADDAPAREEAEPPTPESEAPGA